MSLVDDGARPGFALPSVDGVRHDLQSAGSICAVETALLQKL